MRIDPENEPWPIVYRLLTDTVQPRPIALVSSIDANGHDNLAPFSFFNAVCANPPLLAFSPMRQKSGAPKDTLNNIRATKEYVIAIVGEAIMQRVNQASFDYPPEVSEFDAVGLHRAKAERVAAALVAESPVNFECKLVDIHEYGSGAGSGALVVGEVVLAHVDDRVRDGQRVDHRLLANVGRMGGAFYAQTKETVLTAPRPTTTDPLYADLTALANSNLPAETRLRKCVEALHRARPRHQWTGVYFLRGQTLQLGPYVGAATEHTRIAVGEGLCGQAIANDKDMDVADVTAAPGYLACSVGTRAEAIALIRYQGKVLGQIDVDSDTAGEFGEEAMRSLRAVAEIIAPLVAELQQ